MLIPGSYLINRYEIIMKIGSGGMADVYKAKDHVLNRLVAIKVLKQEYSTDATFVKKFRVEAQSAAGLSHPNIVNVYDVGEDDGVYFIVMELVQGITLKNYIDMKGKLDIREALNISVQIASGLSAAHENRIIHRDIKPQNIIMSRDGKVKVTDFGIAKVADSTTVTTTAAGTVHYISPEQARGGYSDERSDIYSLGITMYEMVTGRVPFEGETNVAVALMHIQSEITPPRQLEPSIPVSFEKIILKCTQKKPERRYASARELIADLRKVLTHPDGEYVVIPGAIPQGRTIVMNDNDIDSLKAASLRKNFGTKPEETYVEEPEEGEEEKPVQKPVQKKRPVKKKDIEEDNDDFDKDEEDDGDEEVNPALSKVMMALGIGGFIILAVIIFFIIGHAAGFFGGSGSLFDHKNKDTSTESISTESVSDTSSDTSTAGERVTVPDLSKMTEDEAKATLKKLSLGATFTVQDDYLPTLLKAYREHVGDEVRIETYQAFTNYLTQSLHNETLDVAFCGRRDREPDIEYFPVLNRSLELGVRADHPLAGRSSIALEELCGQRLITYRRGTPIGEAVQRILEQSPLEGVEALYDDDITMASALSVDGGLAALMLNSIGLKVFSNITTVPLEGVRPDFYWVYLAVNAKHAKTAAVQSFIDFVKGFDAEGAGIDLGFRPDRAEGVSLSA